MTDATVIEKPEGEAGAAAAAAAAKPAATTTDAKPGATAAPAGTAAPAAKPNGAAATTAGGAKPAEVEAYWNEDWRDRLAGSGDKRTKDRKSLDRFADPSAIWNSYKELRDRFDAGGLVKLPSEKATPEELTAYRKSVGVPDAVEDYVKAIKPGEGIVIGDMDKPAIEYYAKIAHEIGVPPNQFTPLINGYFKAQEEAAAKLDQADAAFRQEGERSLKQDFGASYERNMNAIPLLFNNAPEGLFDRLMTGRTADGKVIGNDPEIAKHLVALSRELFPMATVTGAASDGGRGMNERIAEIETKMRTDRSAYFKDAGLQEEYRRLVDARDRQKVRSNAA